MNSLGDYDRWKCDPDWGVREEKCQHCGGVKGECDPMNCAMCDTQTCTGLLVCEECDTEDAELFASTGHWSGCGVGEGTQRGPCDCRERDRLAWKVSCARCGKAGTTAEFIAEEGDEWECAGCNRRDDERERAEVKS